MSSEKLIIEIADVTATMIKQAELVADAVESNLSIDQKLDQIMLLQAQTITAQALMLKSIGLYLVGR